ncbi:MAG: hypothetical protein PHN45_03420, partial [Methylococcales bacterium]|nr:hypothetical protein [Methylococcales bacterium]
MISCIKNNLIKLVLVVLLTVVLSLNYFGFCFGQNRFLSDEEKLNLVINYILLKEKSTLKEIQRVRAMNNSEYKREREKYLPAEPIPYRD